MKKAALFLIILFVTCLVTQAQEDIFKEHGVTKEPLTLSKGKYKETFYNEEIMQVGTVLINTLTNKVVKFLEEDTTKYAYRAEATSRFLTVDPLAEKYYSWSPYVYVGNNPIIRTDPTGMDWYEDEKGNARWFRNETSEEYKDKDGKTWSRTGTTYTTTIGNTLYHFEQGINDDGNQTLKSSKFEIIDEKKAKLQADKEAVRSWQSTDASRSAQQRFWDNPTMGNWFKYVATEVLGQYTDPNRVVGGLSIGVAGYSALAGRSIIFGQNANQVYHAYRHTDGLGLPRSAVSSAVVSDANAASLLSSLRTGQAVNRVIIIEGKTIQYTAFKLPDGRINIGRIHEK